MLDAARSWWENLTPRQRLLVFLKAMLIATLLTIWQVRDIERSLYWIFTTFAIYFAIMIILGWRQVGLKQRLGFSLLATGFLLAPESIERRLIWLQVAVVFLQFVGGMLNLEGPTEQPLNPGEFEEESAEPWQAR